MSRLEQALFPSGFVKALPLLKCCKKWDVYCMANCVSSKNCGACGVLPNPSHLPVFSSVTTLAPTWSPEVPASLHFTAIILAQATTVYRHPPSSRTKTTAIPCEWLLSSSTHHFQGDHKSIHVPSPQLLCSGAPSNLK